MVPKALQQEVLIAYLKPYKSRRFDVVPISKIVTTDTAIAYSNDICYLKDVFPRTDCIILLIDEPDFINSNFQDITDHFTAKGYYKSDEFPKILYDNSVPNGVISRQKRITNLRDCFCRRLCRHDSTPLLTIDRRIVKLIPHNNNNNRVDGDDFMIPPSADEINPLIDDYVYGDGDNENSLVIIRREYRLRLVEVNEEEIVDLENGSIQILVRYYSDKNILVYLSKYVQTINENQPVPLLKKRVRASPSSDYYSEVSTTSDTSAPICTSTPLSYMSGKMAPFKKRYLHDMKRLEETSSSNEEDEQKPSKCQTRSKKVIAKKALIKTEHGQNEQIQISTIEEADEEEEVKVKIKVEEISHTQEERRQMVISESNEEGFLLIGDSGRTKIPKDLFESVKHSKYSAMTRAFLKQLFTREILATSSMTGKMSPAFMNSNKTPRKPLDPTIVKDIVRCVSVYYDISESLVRSIITTKCADEYKMKKMREMKKGKKK